jgi:hypothetical protein
LLLYGIALARKARFTVEIKYPPVDATQANIKQAIEIVFVTNFAVK